VKESLKITLQEISEAWDVLCSIYDRRGIDLRKSIDDTTTTKTEWLSRWGCEADFKTLRKAGCSEVSLVTALWIIHSGPSWSNTWQVVVGSKRHREQTISALEKSVAALERLENSFDVALSLGSGRRRQMKSPEATNGVISEANLGESKSRSIPSPPVLIRALRTYARVLKGFDDVARRTGIHSPEAFGKFLISEFVKTATGDFHDREVAALIGGALRETYTETAHRMWRSRNYKRLEAVSFPVELLIGIGIYFALNA